ncbi:hypothetical protein CPB85DRAFT_1304717 [Mucidula mucida]|nr:hypothetical protein CPB85DRAFT_1304717 [Mucidula mucida]
MYICLYMVRGRSSQLSLINLFDMTIIENLLASSGLIEGHEGSSQLLHMQLGIVQAMPRPEQYKIYQFVEFTAKYLPALVEKYRASDAVLGVAALILNNITFTPYFVRFINSPAGAGLAALQVKRILEGKDTFNPQTVADTEIAELGQLLSTLLVLQGVDDIPADDQKKLYDQILQWVRTMPPVFAVETCERCLMILENDTESREMQGMVKASLEKGLKECGAPGCGRKVQSDGSVMLQCSKCKVAVYCGTGHQKQAWAAHKSLCFEATF